MTTNPTTGCPGWGAGQRLGGGAQISKTVVNNFSKYPLVRLKGEVYKLFFYWFDQEHFRYCLLDVWKKWKENSVTHVFKLICVMRNGPFHILSWFDLIVSVFWLLFYSTHSVELHYSFSNPLYLVFSRGIFPAEYSVDSKADTGENILECSWTGAGWNTRFIMVTV